jgi:alkylation response protein AidB-like acyl-CoA dehydrogenase
MKRRSLAPERDAFRESVRAYLSKEVLPHYARWEKDGIVSSDAWRAAGKQGLLGLAVPEGYGGGGSPDFRAIAAAVHLLEITTQYVKERQAFGRPPATKQHVRFETAEMATECAVTRTVLDRCIEDHADGTLDAVHASMATWWATELQKRVADRCLQLHGGYGYMSEYPVARAFTDGRIQTIYGGTTEIMKEIIGRSLLG